VCAQAVAGKYDRDGVRADAELAAFKRAHDRRLEATYTAEEIKNARRLIHRGLSAAKTKKSKRP
jgi:hypothetical protein